MAEIITEDFKQNLFCPPSGQKKASPTIFDELRWAMQHAQYPLEQVMQLISEFHGVWTGMSQQLMELIALIGGSTDPKYTALAKNALNLLKSSSIPSRIGRVNNIDCNSMPVELLRQFVNRCQSLHPAVNTYIQMNIGKYPYFQQISESVCNQGQIVLDKTQVDLIKRLDSNGDVNMKTSYRIRRNTNTKLFDSIKPLVDVSSNFVDVLFTRGMRVENNMSLIHPSYSQESPIAHGHNFTMDVFDAKRSKDAIQPCIMKVTQKFGSSLRLCNWAFPVEQQIQKTPQWFNLDAETGPYIADELNRPIIHEPAIPVATDKYQKAIV